MGIDYLIFPLICAFYIVAYIIYPLFSFVFFGTFQFFLDEANARQ